LTWLPGLSKSSLHAKLMASDRQGMFVGSFNFDQRSLYINNEIGIVFHEPEIAAQASAEFDANIDKVAFRLTLHPSEGRGESLRWIKRHDGGESVYASEPYAGFWTRLGVRMLRLLPIDSML
jgi:putative cardiolipin synthase